MGGSGSTRRVTVEQPEDLVQLSDSLLKRLAGIDDKSPTPTLSQAQPTPQEYPPPDTKPNIFQNKDIKRRVEKLETDNRKLHQDLQNQKKRAEELRKQTSVTLGEYNRAVDEIEKKFVKTIKVALCDEQEKAVLRCYQTHPTQTLRCSGVAKQFMECVDKYHLSKASRPQSS